MENNHVIVGIDIGNLTTIVSCEDRTIIFESRIEKADELLKLGGTGSLINYANEEYIVGKGIFEKDKYKFRKENFLKLLYFGIAKITDSDRVKLVTGIPAGNYSSRKDEMKAFIKENDSKIIEIYVDGEKVKRGIYIEEVMIVPEGYGIKNLDIVNELPIGRDTLIVDIGGGTTDWAEFDKDMRFLNGGSINNGLSDLYSKVRFCMEDALEYNIPLEQVKDYVDGNKEFQADKAIIENGISRFYREWINELKNYYELKRYNIILAGGGSSKVYNQFKKEYPETLIVSNIQANAVGFRAIGEKKWQKANN